jgi:hypothetical protein
VVTVSLAADGVKDVVTQRATGSLAGTLQDVGDLGTVGDHDQLTQDVVRE